MSMLMGIDVGTTGTKAILTDENGVLLSESYKGYRIYSEKSGYAEQNAEDWWDAVVYTVRDCTKDLKDKTEIKAIALSTQGGSMVPVDKAGRPLSRAAVWMDTRGESQAAALLSGKEKDYYYCKTGWKLSNGLNLIQIQWIKDNDPRLFEKVYKFISTVEYVNCRLVGQPVTDPSNAGMTQLFNILDKKWDADILADLGLKADRLGDIAESGTALGKLRPEAAKELGIPEGTKVVSGGHDQYCAALGAGAVESGEILLSTGTAWVLAAVLDCPVFDPVTYFAPGNHVVPGKWGALATVPTAGVAMEWYRNNLGLRQGLEENLLRVEEFAKIDRKAAEKGPGADGVMFYPHFTGSSCPTWSAKSRAAILGLELHHDRYHIARAVMEGVVFDINWMLGVLAAKGLETSSLKVVGGAAASGLWLQIIADVTGLPVQASHAKNAACIGAAILAGKGAGIYQSCEEGFQRLVKAESAIRPDPARHKTYTGLFQLYTARFEALKSCYQQ